MTELRLDPEMECQAPNCPLWWLTISQDERSSEESVVTFTLDGHETRPIMLDNRNGLDVDRWEGVIEITNDNGHIQSLFVNYSASIKGRWSGNVYYFGHFKDKGIK